MKKVASLFQTLWRRAWRVAERATQILICSTGAGFSVWQLNQITLSGKHERIDFEFPNSHVSAFYAELVSLSLRF